MSSLRNKKLQVLHLVAELKEEGFEVEYDFKFTSGFENEFFLYKVDDGKKILIFSNNESKHSNQEPFPIIGRKINENNMEEE